jgi:hypothetical protein
MQTRALARCLCVRHWHVSRDRLPEWGTLLLYGGMVSVAIAHHESWADEAQAWQISRSNSLRGIFGTYLHYEGAPGLWHLLLWILNKCHVSYGGLHWICGGIAFIGVALLVLRAPFPRPVKLLLPFTYFLAFQYAVIARPYVLFPPLIFTTAAVWVTTRRKPIRTALLLGLIATIALHTAVISCGLAALFGVELRRDYKRQGQLTQSTWRLVAASVILLGFYVGSALAAMPARDVWIANMTATHDERQASQIGLSTAPRAEKRTHPLEWQARASVLRALNAVGWGTIQPILLGIPFWLLIAAAFYQRGILLYLLPVAMCVVFSAIAYVNFWHAGLLVPCLIALYWITWNARSSGRGLRRLELAAIIYAMFVQCAWSVHALAYDYAHAYAPDQATAHFLAPYVGQNTSIAVATFRENGIGAFKSVGILPYFSRNIYMNERMPFWFWSTRNDVAAAFPYALHHHPGIILLEYTESVPYSSRMDDESPQVVLVVAAGYLHTQTFCGAIPEMMDFGEYTCHLVFQPARREAARMHRDNDLMP